MASDRIGSAGLGVRGPSKDKDQGIKFGNVWAEARSILWTSRFRLALGMGLMLMARVAGLVLPYSTKFVINDVIPKQDLDLLATIAWCVGGATILQACCNFALSQVLGVAAQRAITEMRRSVQKHVGRLPISYFDSTQSGKLISRIMTDAEGIRNLVGTGIANLAGGLVTAVLALGYLFYLHWQLTLLTLLVLAVFGGVLVFAFKRLRPMFRERGRITAEVTGRLGESLGGIRVVKAYRAELREHATFTHGVHGLFRNVSSAVSGVAGVSAFSVLIIGVIGLIIMVMGGRAVMAGELDLGELVTYVLFTGMMASPIIQIASIGTQITDAFAGLDRIRELKLLATEDADDVSKAPLPELKGNVSFENVTFEYNPGVEVLKGVSFSAQAGSTTALVGPSGSGKSTLIGLVMAFNHPKAGRVTVDGKDLKSIKLGDFRAHLGVVLQDNFLFDGTVRENIRFGRPYASDEKVRAACKVAHCDEFIRRFENGYDSIVGERGIKLSGGQRQRVAIARAILADPRILILDEATSSLDSESEAKIQDGLDSLRKGRTTFVIAHRLSTIRSADRILVLDEGEIVEQGNHEELLVRDGLYRRLYDRQYHWERNRFINPGEDFTPEPPKVEAPKKGNDRSLKM